MKNIKGENVLVIIISLLIFLIFTFPVQQTVINAEELSELNTYLKKSTIWKCTTLKKEIPLKIYFKEKTSGLQDAPVIVYVRNRGGERIGQESDLSILQDYIEQRYIIITIDFNSNPRAVSPHFDRDLHQIFKAVYGHETTSLLEDIGLKPIQHRCFFLPAGYRVATDLLYWEIDKHAVYGTLKYIMFTYNESVAGKVPGKKRVSSPEEMTDLQGKPFDYKIYMDIVYPSKAKKKVPLVYYLATQPTRLPAGSPKQYRPHMVSFTMRGYAYALIGHCYNPVVKHYRHIERFTLDHWTGLACYTAAIRFIRAHAEEYNINPNYIGGVGHSKGQYSVTRLSNPHHADEKEDQRFKGEPEGTPESQPLPGYPSHISVGYQSMGMGLYRPQYITRDYAPTIVACGENERLYVRLVGHPNFVKYLEELDVNHIELLMKGLGHELLYGYDEDLGIDRYQLMHDFFDRYLKVESKLPPVVLILTPRDKKENVLSSEKISIHFAPVMDKRSITDGDGVKIIRLKDNTNVKGSWKISHGGTKFTYTPEQRLKENEKYRVIVTTNVKNEMGTYLDKEKISEFKVAKR